MIESFTVSIAFEVVSKHVLVLLKVMIYLYNNFKNIILQDIFFKPLFVAVMWLMKNFFIYIILCLNFEKFYIGLEDSQNSCALLSKTRNSGIYLAL